MEKSFQIALYIKTLNGFEGFGRFHIGHDSKLAIDLFRKLKGVSNNPGKSPLQMDLIQVQNGLPINIDLIGCTLEDMADNCKIITKEVFKMTALESDSHT